MYLVMYEYLRGRNDGSDLGHREFELWIKSLKITMQLKLSMRCGSVILIVLYVYVEGL